MKPLKNMMLTSRLRKGLDMDKRWFVLLGLIVSLLSGCTLAPEYSKPASPVPADWPTGAAYQDTKTTASVPTAADLPWREFFKVKGSPACFPPRERCHKP